MSDADAEIIAKRAFDALRNWELDAYEALLADDAIETRPQLNERFVGRANIMGMYRSVPASPRVEWTSVTGGGSSFTAQGTIHYGDGWDHLVAVIEVRRGNVIRGDFYFAPQLPQSPPYHADWAEKTPVPSPRPRS